MSRAGSTRYGVAYALYDEDETGSFRLTGNPANKTPTSMNKTYTTLLLLLCSLSAYPQTSDPVENA